MKVKNKALTLAVSYAKTAASKGTISNGDIRLTPVDNALHVYGASTEITMESVVTDENGRSITDLGDRPFLVNGQHLLECLRLLKDTLTIRLVDNTLHLDDGESRFRMQTSDAASYPERPKAEYEAFVCPKFAQYVSEVAHALDTGNNKTFSANIHIEVDENGGLRATALDAHRVSIRDSLNPSSGVVHDIVLPGEALVSAVQSIKDDGDIRVYIAKDKGSLEIVGASVKVTLTASGKSFPDISRVMERLGGHTISFDKDGIERGLRVVSLTAKDKRSVMKVAGSRIHLSSMTMDYASEADVKSLNVWDKDELIIGLNAQLLMEAIDSAHSARIDLGLSSPKSPIQVRSEREDVLEIIMPMMIG